MYFLWLISLLMLFFVCASLLWVYFCLTKHSIVDAETEVQQVDDVSWCTSDQDFSNTKSIQRKGLDLSLPFPRFVQQYDERTQKKQKYVISTGLKHLRAINKQIQKQQYFVSVTLLEKQRKLQKMIRKKKGKYIKLPPIYENAKYFEEE